MVADLIALDNKARVWIYPSDGVFTDDQRTEMQSYLYKFLGDWTAHNQALKSYGNLFHNQFLTLFVDETLSQASGCSIDSSVRFVQELGKHFQADFFNRMLFSYMDTEENVYTLNAAEFKESYAAGTINDETLVFDHLVKTKEEFLNSWLKPLSNSWHKRFV